MKLPWKNEKHMKVSNESCVMGVSCQIQTSWNSHEIHENEITAPCNVNKNFNILTQWASHIVQDATN